jgi:phosphopantothenoylcysteine decarboxylase / phosphopantothenate---cysteine ligase
VVSAQQMYEACHKAFTKSDITIMAAAVADYKPKKVAENKIKKSNHNLVLELEATKDILKSLGEIKSENQILVGFALETENSEKNALKKLNEKNLDFVVLNSPAELGSGFGFDTNKITIIQKNGQIKEFSLRSKRDVANDILNSIDFIIENKA